jgi:ethanolamine utilization microcompartment shell protein EutS
MDGRESIWIYPVSCFELACDIRATASCSFLASDLCIFSVALAGGWLDGWTGLSVSSGSRCSVRSMLLSLITHE